MMQVIPNWEPFAKILLVPNLQNECYYAGDIYKHQGKSIGTCHKESYEGSNERRL